MDLDRAKHNISLYDLIDKDNMAAEVFTIRNFIHTLSKLHLVDYDTYYAVLRDIWGEL